MPRSSTAFACSACGHPSPRWAGRCGACGAWGSIQEARSSDAHGAGIVVPLDAADLDPDRRITIGLPDLDRVLGGGLVPGSVILLAGEPGIGKSTLLLHLLGALVMNGRPCLLASGEESRAQIAARARRLQLDAGSIAFVSGRDLAAVVAAAGQVGDGGVVAVDSVQTVRDADAPHAVGGVAQVRATTDALSGLAKATGVTVVMTGHVTKDGDLAGPRALEHAVDVVLTFDGDPRSGLRVLAAGKNRFGAEGETAWFEMGSSGLAPVDPSRLLISGEGFAGAAIALPQRGRRAIAVEIQALIVPGDGPGRRQATGLDPRRFQLVGAVLDRVLGVPLARAEVYGASSGGVRVDDPAADLAIAAALASAASGQPTPPGTAFVGEVALTGQIRPVAGMSNRVAAARAAGCGVVYAPTGPDGPRGVRIVPVRHLEQALTWCGGVAEAVPRSLPA